MVRRNMSNNAWTALVLFLMLTLVVTIAFSVQGCTAHVASLLAGLTPDNSSTSGGDDSFSTIDDDEVVCDWATVDSGSYLVLSGLRSEWRATVPTGSFRYSAQCDQRVDFTLTKDYSSLDYTQNAYSETFYFDGPGSYGLAISNPTMYHASCELRLDQWVCSDDPLNWAPDVFSNVYNEQQFTQVDCWSECLGVGYYGGSTIDEQTTVEQCSSWGNVVVGACCCWTQQPIIS